MKIDVLSIPDEGKELIYQEDPLSLHLSPDLELKGEVKIKGFLYKTGRTIIVKGTIEAEPHFECGRCSIGFYQPLVIEFDQIFIPKTQTRAVHHKNQVEKKRERPSYGGRVENSESEAENEIDPLVENFYEGTTLSLDDMVREQILLALPMRPLCSPDCKGLCPVCKKNLNHSACNCPKEENDNFTIKLFLNQGLKGKKGE
ncbi:MAG: YceD family protein [Nitrospiria bacterium]